MKNLKDNNHTEQSEPVALFKDLPTSREADEMETGLVDYTPKGYSEQRLTERTIAKLRREMAAEAPKRNRRRGFRILLIAACTAVLLLGTALGAREIIHSRRLNEMLGISGDAGELENSFIELGLTQTRGDITVTLVDSIGDAYNLWVEVQTNLKFKDPTPEGWMWDDPWPMLPARIGEQDYRFLDTSLDNYGLGLHSIPFCRDGYLWFMMYLTSDDTPFNKTDLRLTFTLGGFEFGFTLKNNYETDEKKIPLNTVIGDITITEVDLNPSRITIYAEREPRLYTSNPIELESITLTVPSAASARILTVRSTTVSICFFRISRLTRRTR